jgi:peptidoglycan/LPS O-acetylase OafA/YrhL
MTKKQYQTLLIINIIFFYIWPTFFTNTTVRDNGYGIINFINLFLIGAYIKTFVKTDISKKKTLFIFIASVAITTVFSFVASRAWRYSSVFNLISSIALFLLFKSIKIKNNKFINNLATYTFSTYIIHENIFLSKILYRTVFNSDKYWNNNLMILNLMISVLGIFIICIIIENIRKLLFKKIFDDKIDKIDFIIECK